MNNDKLIMYAKEIKKICSSFDLNNSYHNECPFYNETSGCSLMLCIPSDWELEEKDSNEVKLGDTVYSIDKIGKVTKIGEHDYIIIIGEKETKKKEKEVWIETEDGYQCLLVKCLKPIEKGVWDYDRRIL